MGWGEGVDEAGDLGPAKDCGEVFWAAGSDGLDRLVEGLFQDVAEEEEEGVEGLVLGGGRDLAFDGEVGEESADVGSAEVARKAAMVEQDVAANLAQVAGFGAEGVVFAA
jgi:hypothetical protein